MAKKRPENDVDKSMLPVLAYIKRRNMSEAEFVKELKIDHGRFSNWKSRGIPQGMRSKIAAKIGKGTDDYLAEIGRPTGAVHRDEEVTVTLDPKAVAGLIGAIQRNLDALKLLCGPHAEDGRLEKSGFVAAPAAKKTEKIK